MKVKTLLLAAALMAAQTFGQDPRLRSWARHVQMRDESPFRGLHWLSLGPRFQGGRVETIDAVPGTGIIYVGFGSGSVWKTTNHGLTWTPIFDDQPTYSIGDLAVSRSHPNILYVGTGENLLARSSLAGVGVFKSADGGETWKRLAGGLPGGPYIGRIGLAVAPSAPHIVYAFLSNQTPVEETRPEGKRTVPTGPEVYRSDDRGETWRKLPMKSDRVRNGFYGDIVVSPDDPEMFYALGQNFMRSEDGGRTFQYLHGLVTHLYDHPSPALHLDQHDLWIDPTDAKRLILGNDGGVYLSTDGGATWLHLNNIPAGEFYALSVDEADPYFIYGGTQDDAALFGPANRVPLDGIRDPWRYVWIDLWGGGDSYVTAVDPADAGTIYFERQFGDFQRKNMRTGESKRIRPRANKGEPELRYNWMSPFMISRHNPGIVYFGANKLFRSLNRGDNWMCISPDLTTQPGPEKQGNVPYGTITTISESPLRPGLLYVGTDDGRVWVTRNDGAEWTEVGRGFPPKWIGRVVASGHALGTAYVTLTGYRENDYRPYIFKTADFGATWESIAAGLPEEQVNVIREDPRSGQTLYIGTDQGGVYVTKTGGKSWLSLCANLPPAAVHDIAVQGRERELVIGTHGRSIFKIDIAPVQDLTEDIVGREEPG